MIFTTVTVTITSFFTPSRAILSPTPTPTTQQVLILEETIPTQTSQQDGSKSIVRQKVSPFPTATITQIQSNINLTPISSVNPTTSDGNLQTTTDRPKACFTVSSKYVYNDDIYYLDYPVDLIAVCSQNVKDIKEFRWYISGNYGATIKPTGIIVNTNIDHIYGDSNTIKSYEIKLEVIGKDGSTDSTVKTIRMKELPKLKSCISPDSSTRRYINFNEEVTFSGACTQDNPENPIIKSYWRFRDGGSSDSIIREGKEVTHKFIKFANTFRSVNCGNSGGKGFEAEFCIETKLGIGGFCTIHQYCPSENDPVLQNLQNCSKQQGKDLDKCIIELNL